MHVTAFECVWICLFQPYLSFSVSVFMKNGISTDEDENPNAHGERPEHLHPLRVTMLFQEPGQSASSLLGGRAYMQNTEGWSYLISGIFRTDITVSLAITFKKINFQNQLN